jgi:hypothetical protein
MTGANKKTANLTGSRPRDLGSEISVSVADDQRGRSRRPSSVRRGRPRIHMSQVRVMWSIRWRRMGEGSSWRQPPDGSRNRNATVRRWRPARPRKRRRQYAHGCNVAIQAAVPASGLRGGDSGGSGRDRASHDPRECYSGETARRADPDERAGSRKCCRRLVRSRTGDAWLSPRAFSPARPPVRAREPGVPPRPVTRGSAST